MKTLAAGQSKAVLASRLLQSVLALLIYDLDLSALSVGSILDVNIEDIQIWRWNFWKSLYCVDLEIEGWIRYELSRW